MASYGALVRKITTAELNRVQREGGYTRWVYFVDEFTNKVGVLYANDTNFGAYTVEDVPDPKLNEFGLEKIADLHLTEDPDFLVLLAGENELRATLFGDPFVIQEDEFATEQQYDYAKPLRDWQLFLKAHGVQMDGGSAKRLSKRMAVAVVTAAVLLIVAFQLFG